MSLGLKRAPDFRTKNVKKVYVIDIQTYRLVTFEVLGVFFGVFMYFAACS